jgi:DNA-binding ferritin-like protein
MLNNIKLYHWKTKSYAQHKATDELYDKLNKNIDKFIETLLGKDELRIKMLKKRVDLLDTKNTNEFKSRIYEYREFLLDMNDIFDEKRDSDILSIRDEILSDLNQFLYLLTFDK